MHIDNSLALITPITEVTIVLKRTKWLVSIILQTTRNVQLLVWIQLYRNTCVCMRNECSGKIAANWTQKKFPLVNTCFVALCALLIIACVSTIPPNMTDIRLHRVRFYLGDFYSINCIAYNEKNQKVALLRRRLRKHRPSQSEVESLIEIWNMQHKAPFLEQTIFDDSDNLSLLESLCWSKSGRLFSCGLNAYLNEYDLANNKIKQSYDVNSSPAWCLAIDKADELLAVGTEDGYICVFKLYDNFVEYDKVLDKTDNRILCLDWQRHAESGNLLLFAGSIDYIKIWAYKSGKCIDSIKVGNTRVVVWTLKVLSDQTIVSGDSNGTISFWNGKMATLNVSFNTETKADILSLCVDNKENRVFAACVDSRITQYSRDVTRPTNWIKGVIRRPHTHDVRALCFAGPTRLLSGGVDSLFMQTHLVKSGPRPLDSYASYLPNIANKISVVVTPEGSFVGLQFRKYIQIWKLGCAEEGVGDNSMPNSTNITQLSIIDNARKMLEVTSRKMLISFAMNRTWLVYANYANLKIFHWDVEKVEKVKLLSAPVAGVGQIVLDKNNRMVVSHGRMLEYFKLDKFGVVPQHSAALVGRVAQMCTDQHKLFVSVDDEKHSIQIYNMKTYELIGDIINPLTPLTMAINTYTGAERLVVAYANSVVSEYNLATYKLITAHTLSSLKSNENKECKDFNENWPIKQIAFAEGMILFSNDNNMYGLNVRTSRLTKCEGYRHIVAMTNLSLHELVVVEVTPDMIFGALPPAFSVKTFGT